MKTVKINGVRVKFIKRLPPGTVPQCLLPVIVQKAQGWVDDKAMRRICVRALKAASRRKARSMMLCAAGSSLRDFPVVAVAKVMAQEVFRHLREEKHSFKEIILVVDSTKNFEVFRRTASNYLNHMLFKICQGPFLTVDALIEVKGGIVLIKRSNPPFGWAIPGGFVDYGESLEHAVAREAREETSLVVKNLKQMHTYSRPGRDPRFHTVSTVFVGQAKGKPRAASDAQEAKVCSRKEWEALDLAFDHRQVLEDYLQYRETTLH